MAEKNLLERGKEFVEEGGLNLIPAAAFGLLGFKLTMNFASHYVGGGFFNTLFAIPIAFTGAMLAAVGGVRLFHGVKDWFTETVTERDGEQPEPLRARGRERQAESQPELKQEPEISPSAPEKSVRPRARSDAQKAQEEQRITQRQLKKAYLDSFKTPTLEKGEIALGDVEALDFELPLLNENRNFICPDKAKNSVLIAEVEGGYPLLFDTEEASLVCVDDENLSRLNQSTLNHRTIESNAR